MSIMTKLDVRQPQDGSWFDLTGDVLAGDPIKFDYGIKESGIENRMGTSGKMTFVLDNEERNSQYKTKFESLFTAAGPYTPNLQYTTTDTFDLWDYKVFDSDGIATGEFWFQVGNKVRLMSYESRVASSKDGSYVGTSHAKSAVSAARTGVLLAASSHINLFYTGFSSDFDGATGSVAVTFDVADYVYTTATGYLFNIAVDASNYVRAYLTTDGLLHCEHDGSATLASIVVDWRTLVTLPSGSLPDVISLVMKWDVVDGLVAYLNGAKIGQVAIGTWAGTPVRFVVGSADTDGTTPLINGYALGCAFWNSAISRPDLMHHPNEHRSWHPDVIMSVGHTDSDGAKRLIAYWPFNEGSGTTAQEWSATPMYFNFVGRIKTITPDTGKFSKNSVKVEASDWLDDAAVYKIRDTPPQVDVTIDKAMMAVVQYSPSQPSGLILTTGADTFSFTTFDTRRGVTVLSELAKLAASEFGLIYMRGTVNTEGVPGTALVNESRHTRIVNTTPAFSITDDGTSDVIRLLKVTQNIEDVKNVVEIVTHPAVVDAANVVVSSLPSGNVLAVPATGTYIYTAPYLDSDNAFKVVGVKSIAAPVRNVDFTINSTPTGTGVDLSNDYRSILLLIDASNLLAYFILNDQASGAFRNEADPIGQQDVAQSSRGGSPGRRTTTSAPPTNTNTNTGSTGATVEPGGDPDAGWSKPTKQSGSGSGAIVY